MQISSSVAFPLLDSVGEVAVMNVDYHENNPIAIWSLSMAINQRRLKLSLIHMINLIKLVFIVRTFTLVLRIMTDRKYTTPQQHCVNPCHVIYDRLKHKLQPYHFHLRLIDEASVSHLS